jgi:hypothetical protein
MMTVVHDDAPGWLCAACVFIESNAAGPAVRIDDRRFRDDVDRVIDQSV